jgi:hypothetical protein
MASFRYGGGSEIVERRRALRAENRIGRSPWGGLLTISARRGFVLWFEQPAEQRDAHRPT